jgi:hypothetical protein
VVDFYAKDEFKQRIASYFDALEPGSASAGRASTAPSSRASAASFRAREGFEVDDPDRSAPRAGGVGQSSRRSPRRCRTSRPGLGKEPQTLPAESLDELAGRSARSSP